MEELLNNIWVQGGAAGLLIASGWIMWWLERKERLAVQDRRDKLLEEFLTFMHDYKELLEKLTESMTVEKLIEDAFERLKR